MGTEKMKEVKYTEVEKRLIDVISNFFLWYSTQEDRGIVEQYMGEEHVNYNDWFELKKDFIGYHKIKRETS